jgi:iron complex outermembrane receptor protein
MFRLSLLAGTAVVLLPQPSLAQPPETVAVPADAPATAPAEAAPQQEAPQANNDYHAQESQEIVVTGFRRNRSDVLSGTSVLSGENLARDVRPTIGESLARLPGVSATSYGPNASRPVLRGFQGERIRVMTDGIGSLDVSNTSVDHAVAINPLTADRIEVLRGPSALLFGSSAIGGVVNVIDARIPRRVPDDRIHVEGLATYGSAADERSGNLLVDVPIGSDFVVHADANYSKTGDMRSGGYLLSPALRRQAAASPDPDIQALADLRGEIPNSQGRSWDVAGGAAWIHGENNVGLSISRLDSLYGIPIRFSLDPAGEAERVRIDLRQTRVDGRAEIDTGSGFIDSVRFRGGYSDYQHSELEEDGAVGTTFFNTGYEGRLEAVQTTRGGWGGGFGAQYYHRRLDTVGDEKSLPTNTTNQLGLFALENYSRGLWRAEAGVRYEHQTVDAEADAIIGNPALSRSYDSLSGSVGAAYGTNALRAGINLSHTQRAPSAEELYVNGPHPGTQAFEIGDPDLVRESSNGVELTLHGAGNGYSFGAAAYSIWFNNYIYEQATGAIQDDLPVFQYLQADARYLGFEVEGSARLATIGSVTLNADALADYVRATVETTGPAPRIPPLRVLGGIEAQGQRLNGRVEVEWVNDQNRIAAFETPTKGYTMVNASLAYHPFGSHNLGSIVLSANNIFDVVARRHASFLKDYAPLAGRDLRITARFSF